MEQGERHMSIAVYLNFDGDCREAVEFYAQVFGAAKPQIMTFGEAPPNPSFTVPEGAKDRVMHAELSVQGTMVMFSDTMPGMPLVRGNNFSLTVVSKDMDEIKSLFAKLKEGGKVGMDLQETFWSKCYGSLTDKFGIQWQVSHEAEQTTA